MITVITALCSFALQCVIILLSNARKHVMAKLKEYKRKRNFRRTPEPKGKVIKGDNRPLLYVIQKHAASHLHYDFRLELEGVLVSWAVPKGPSLNPADKRLAVHVEDHPLEYGSFEGIIPQGEYGGGTVMVWDMGEWQPEGDPKKMYRQGRLTFQLFGKKLKGLWSLVQMKGAASAGGKNWLLIKHQDAAAKTGEFDITVAKGKSALTGRTMEEIAEEAS